MNDSSCILIFDIGKTNKKVFLLDKSYNILYEKSDQLAESKDEDGFPCEDVYALTRWVQSSFKEATSKFGNNIKAVNCAAYGASFVHVDTTGKSIAPLYNYLKPYPAILQEKLYAAYGGEEAFSLQTSSPSLGSLNSGLQLYRLKMEQPSVYEKIQYSLHLPQYISSLFSQTACSDLTSIGCHTGLWDFPKKNYHTWVTENKINSKLAPVMPGDRVSNSVINETQIQAGVGLHDSSAALVPYIRLFPEPFLLISTGTWCISLNPFNNCPLTKEELKQDCLSYLTGTGNPVKASRLFAGKWHEDQVLRMAEHFHINRDYFSSMRYDPKIIYQLERQFNNADFIDEQLPKKEGMDFTLFDLSLYPSAEMAYHRFMQHLIKRQAHATDLVLKNTDVVHIYVDGGFSNNDLFMHLLAEAFPAKSVFSAVIAQASAFGAAMTIHQHWNDTPIPGNLITLKKYD